MATVQGFSGMQYARDGNSSEKLDYSNFNVQYASSSCRTEHDMNPAYIFKPKGDEDIIKVVKWAIQAKIAIAVKSGGHQYSGASSCGGKNVQVDLGDTYRDLRILPTYSEVSEDKQAILVGVSNRLRDLLAYLKHIGLFVPMGQCASVGLGGHVQTGGYGQMSRSFGLLGDHVLAIRLVDCNAEMKEITRTSNPELFYALLGGSPGNLGIITHYIMEAHKSECYQGTVAGPHGYKGPHMIKAMYLYDRATLVTLLTYLAEMSDAGDTPRGYELCVSVVSADYPIATLFPVLSTYSAWQKLMSYIKDASAHDEALTIFKGRLPAFIIVYASWCPINKDDVYDETVDGWFDRFRKLSPEELPLLERDVKMSSILQYFMPPREREFELPYIKRTYATSSTTLVQDQWPQQLASRIDLICNPKQRVANNQIERDLYKHCRISAQMQYFGGSESLFFRNRNNGTSFSWRDSTMVQVLDCFHAPTPEHKAVAERWQAENDATMIGPDGAFSKQDRRVLWGSYGDWDLSKPEVWRTYYEGREKYERLGKIRAKADPAGTFTPNPFAVKAVYGVPVCDVGNERSKL